MSNWVWLLIAGIIGIAGGIFGLFNPMASSVATEIIVAWGYIIAGGVQFFEAFRAEKWSGKLLSAALGILAIVLGIALIRNPLAGLAALTMVLGIMILIGAGFQIYGGMKVNETGLRWLMIAGGVVSIILGFMILANWPGSSAVALGVLMSIQLISFGSTAVALAFSRRKG